MQTFLDDKIMLHAGNCLDVLRTLPDASIDSCVTDPPYALVSITKRFGGSGAAPAQHGTDGLYARASAGFMGKQWDTGDVAFSVELWVEVLRVLKPGGHLLAFGGTRTYHRLAVAVEDAGFEIRDQIGWCYGSGFPKSHNRIIDGVKWGTALKPAWEPIVLARKPLIGTVAENVLEHGTGALNIDGCRVETDESIVATRNIALGSSGAGVFGAATVPGIYEQQPGGRWPANIIHDGSDEVLAAFPDTAPGTVGNRGLDTGIQGGKFAAGERAPWVDKIAGHADSGGSAARFFYTAKADADDRIGSKHPTVKPLDLMQYLVRLVTPPGGTVLDPFAGTGTTGEAAWREGMKAVLIEREAEYQADIARRMELAENPTKRAAVAKSKNNLKGAEGTPLFPDE
jgi:site-specific DNA-methyltransferase (adenine-specific)